MSELRLGIVGAGLITARSHLPAALACPAVRVTALVDPVIERAQQLVAGARAEITVADRLDAVLGDVDAVLIATPNHTHADLAVAALQAGVHTLIEKPLATTRAEGEAILGAAERSGCVAAVGFCTRFEGAVELMHQLLEHGFFGKIRRFAYQLGGTVGWDSASAFHLDREAAGGGVLVTQGSHFLDRMLYWFGFPEGCSLEDDSLGGPEANAIARFGYPGFEGSARFSKTAALAGGFAMESERGIAVLREQRNACLRFRTHEQPELEQVLEHAKAPRLPGGNVFERQLADFARACVEGGEPRVALAQGFDVIRLVEDLYSHRRPSPGDWYEGAE